MKYVLIYFKKIIIIFRKLNKLNYIKLNTYRSIVLENTIDKLLKNVITKLLNYLTKIFYLLSRNHFEDRSSRITKNVIIILIENIYII